jgi:hypothetical protein
MDTYNIYCDESCHLEHDHQKVMGLGACWCSLETSKSLTKKIRDIKIRHKLNPNVEIKWIKVSPSKLDFYIELINLFSTNEDLHFRGLIIPDKENLNHEKFDQTHDDWYYKMYFELIKEILFRRNKYNIYIDIKDTIGKYKIEKLCEVLRNTLHDFSGEIIQRVQQVRSHEVNILQITDLLLGALVYANRDERNSPAKIQLVELIEENIQFSLNKTTLRNEDKFNILIWKASNLDHHS